MEAIAKIWIEKIIYDHFSMGIMAWTKWDACFNWTALAFSISVFFFQDNLLKPGFDQIE